jgi:uncharacterized protein YegJ (DUF2314 family)
VDTFSYFRQRRNSPPGRPVPPPTEVRIPLVPTPTFSLMVYCRYPSEYGLPSERDAEEMVWNWIQENSSDPLKAAVISYFEQGHLSMELHERGNVPPPPDTLIRAFNPGEAEERRYRDATHVVVIEATDLLLPPRVGLWAVTASARALAGGMSGGVILDPQYPRLLPLATHGEPLPPDGRIRVVDHILVPYSTEPETGLLWVTTKGMDRFGLPELEVVDVPPGLAASLVPVVNAIGQRLVEGAMAHALEHGEANGYERLTTLPMRAEVTLTLDDVRRAYARSEAEIERMEAEDAEAEDDSPGVGLVRLQPLGGGRQSPPLIRLVAPLSEGRDPDDEEPGAWIHALVDDLFGEDPELALVDSEDPAMEEAHQRAVSELPLVRSRFQAGFRSGEVLHVKHGFETPADSHEYMWIAVTGWGDGLIRGRLTNDPQHRRDLRAGQNVEIDEDGVYDWLIVHADGRTEGAYTNRVLTAGEDE